MPMPETKAAVELYDSWVTHERRSPPHKRFRHHLPRLLIDLDRLPELPDYGIRHNAWGPVSFSERDHGPRDGRPLKPWILARLAENGLSVPDGRVWLWTYPRIWGYVFNPLSLWYCEDARGTLRTVVLEVRNTFGETHFYLIGGGESLASRIRYRAAKSFHVSPFQPLSGHYRFTLLRSSSRRTIRIDYEGTGGPRLMAFETACRSPDPVAPTLRHWAWVAPWTTIGVTLAIHAHALCLWRKGAALFHKPPPPEWPWTRGVEVLEGGD